MRIFSRSMIAGIMVAVVGTACASAGDQVGAEGSFTSPIAPTPETRVSIANPTVPSLPSIVPPVNNNSQDTALSRLCWARREVVLAIADQISQAVGPEPTVLDVDEVSVAIEPAVLQLGQLSNNDLPAALAPFLERFKKDLSALSKMLSLSSTFTLEQLVSAFDFERYPAVAEYINLTNFEAGCTDA